MAGAGTCERLLAEERAGWSAAHAEAVGLLRQIAAAPPPTAIGAASELLGASAHLVDAQFRSTIRVAEQREAATHAHLKEKLRERIEEHEQQLERMYAALVAFREFVGTVGPVVASERGPHGLSCSLADRCTAAASIVEAHEAELQFKWSSLNQIEQGVDDHIIQTLLIAWSLQPMTAEASAVEAAMDEQCKILDPALSTASGIDARGAAKANGTAG
eukprot:scaffold313000_cov36-Tisochrysis_lutea.AAC.2